MSDERDFYDDLLGKGPGDPDFHLDPNARWVGVDKPVVQVNRFEADPPFEFGDNNKSDPEQNWEEDND